MRTSAFNSTVSRRPRRGFTLIELLVAMSIIALLIALLLPAINGAWRTAKDSRVRSEISSMEGSISQFKTVYGIEPPSRIILFEAATGVDSWADYPTDQAERIRSRELIKQMWTHFDFTLDRDINRDSDATDVHILTGAECLVFFLGGLPDASGMALNGFSKDPADPFAPGGARDAPLFDFLSDRLGGDADADGFIGYIGPVSNLGVPYLYLSSNGGTGYQAADLFVGSGDDLDDIYRETDGTTARMKSSYQIIFPGADGLYGAGGAYDPDNASLLNLADQDNITNFQSGRLSP